MNMKFLATSATAALLLAAPAMAATFTFDDFSTAQFAADSPSPFVPGENTSTVPGGPTSGFVGTERVFNASNTQFVISSERATSLLAGSNQLAFNNVAGSRGLATLTYSNFDLKNTGDKGFFEFSVIAFDGKALFTVEAEDSGGNFVSYSEPLDGGGFSPILRFNQLAGYEAFDFGEVAWLTFGISSVNTLDSIDGRIGPIEVSAVPVPAAGLLLLGALGGAAALRRRKTAKKAA